MKWTDIADIVEGLIAEHPIQDPATIRFTDLREKIMALKDFDDEPKHCNERVLEAVQQRWIEEIE